MTTRCPRGLVGCIYALLLRAAQEALLATALEIEASDWAEATKDTPLFIRLLDPERSDHNSDQDWQELEYMYQDNVDIVVGHVNCVKDAENRALCERLGVSDFSSPVLKWGKEAELKRYDGEHDLHFLQGFAAKKLTKPCEAEALERCKPEVREKVERWLGLDDSSLSNIIQLTEGAHHEAEERFAAELRKMQERYKELEEERRDAVNNMWKAGLRHMKSVKGILAEKRSKEEAPAEEEWQEL
eukprot:TRINITY_DN23145_c0_g2_i2.p1 TRINITY_DN23145_c0_g2~~TRINITY_DN23145_c0_g2_i2.p1  ORF type:complete len:243 (-),score=85.82 TRINITY_DN23145_c0_g2_i2:336-1064(-)